jgi:hypothetical protein
VVDYESLIACRMMGCMAFILCTHDVAGAGRRCSCYTFLDGAGWIDLPYWLGYTVRFTFSVRTQVLHKAHDSHIHGAGWIDLATTSASHFRSGLRFCTRHMIHTYTGRTAFGF